MDILDVPMHICLEFQAKNGLYYFHYKNGIMHIADYKNGRATIRRLPSNSPEIVNVLTAVEKGDELEFVSLVEHLANQGEDIIRKE